MGSVRGNETNLSLRKKERWSRDLSTRRMYGKKVFNIIYIFIIFKWL